MKTIRFMALTKVIRSAVCIMWYRNGIKWQKHSAFFEGYATAQELSCHCLVAVTGVGPLGVHVRFMGNKMTVDRNFSRISHFSCNLSFHQFKLLYHCHPADGQ